VICDKAFLFLPQKSAFSWHKNFCYNEEKISCCKKNIPEARKKMLCHYIEKTLGKILHPAELNWVPRPKIK